MEDDVPYLMGFHLEPINGKEMDLLNSTWLLLLQKELR